MDSTRPPPPQGAPPSYAFVTRVYRRNLRPIVITTAFLGAVWSLFSGIGWFRSFGIDRDQNASNIANLSVALGAMYMAVFVIGLFGMYSAATQRAGLVRLYTLLAAFATLIIIGSGLTRVVTHFVWKNDIIAECTTLTTGGRVVYYGFWGPIKADVLSASEAALWCRRSWERNSWSEIIAFLILTLLASLFTALALAYHRQLLDPTSAANASRRAPSAQARLGMGMGFGSGGGGGGGAAHYNPPYTTPYGSSLPDLPYAYAYTGQPGYGQGQGYGQGLGQGQDEAFVPPYEGKPPGYTGRGVEDVKDGNGGGDAKDSDPFVDFEGRRGGGRGDEERDVTSRPFPGGPETFR